MINFHDVIICIVQGICEIIPVSSSASMMAVQRLFDTTNIALHFKVALHIGSLLAIMVFFRKEIFNIFQALFTQKKKIIDTYFWHLAIGTIPLVIISLYAQNYVKHFNNCKIIGFFCILFGVVLYVVDRISVDSKKSHKNIPFIKIIIVGFFQSIAIIPGVSRLGICITSCRMLSIPRKQAVEFSLMLAMPSIFGSICLMFTPEMFALQNLYLIAIVCITSLIAIYPLTSYMIRNGFFGIVIYRLIIGAMLLL